MRRWCRTLRINALMQIMDPCIEVIDPRLHGVHPPADGIHLELGLPDVIPQGAKRHVSKGPFVGAPVEQPRTQVIMPIAIDRGTDSHNVSHYALCGIPAAVDLRLDVLDDYTAAALVWLQNSLSPCVAIDSWHGRRMLTERIWQKRIQPATEHTAVAIHFTVNDAFERVHVSPGFSDCRQPQ